MKLSATMQDALSHAQPDGLVRWPGGFWTVPGCAVVGTVAGWRGESDVPAWHVGAGTIYALIERGRLAIAERNRPGGMAIKVIPTDSAAERHHPVEIES